MVTKKLAQAALAGVLSLGIVACGGSTNNDFGVAFSHLGYFQADATFDSCGTIPTEGLSGATLAINAGGGDSEGVVASLNPQLAFGSVFIQSNLSQVALVGGELRYSFSVPGNGTSIPSTAIALPVTLGPATSGLTVGGAGGGEGEEGGDGAAASGGIQSSLPPAFEDLCNQSLLQVPLIPSDILEFLNFNESALPELPFFIEVTTTATGVTTAGDFIESNPRTISVELVEGVGVPPTSGSGGLGGATEGDTLGDSEITDGGLT